jgi:hypothetical protein
VRSLVLDEALTCPQALYDDSGNLLLAEIRLSAMSAVSVEETNWGIILCTGGGIVIVLRTHLFNHFCSTLIVPVVKVGWTERHRQPSRILLVYSLIRINQCHFQKMRDTYSSPFRIDTRYLCPKQHWTYLTSRTQVLRLLLVALGLVVDRQSMADQ